MAWIRLVYLSNLCIGLDGLQQLLSRHFLFQVDSKILPVIPLRPIANQNLQIDST